MREAVALWPTSLPKMHWPAEMTRKPESPRLATIMLDSRTRPTHAVQEPATRRLMRGVASGQRTAQSL